MKHILILFLSLPIITVAQTKLILIDTIMGTFTTMCADTTCVTDAYVEGDITIRSKTTIISNSELYGILTIDTSSCEPACEDNFAPSIAVLKDSCIRDEEWFIKSDYHLALPDSGSFFLGPAMDLFQSFGIHAVDDCQLDTFFVKEVNFSPTGGPDRPPGSTKEIRVLFRAEDSAGKHSEREMLWIRDDSGCI